MGIPKVDRAASLQCMLKGWEELPEEIGANSSSKVRVLPVLRATRTGIEVQGSAIYKYFGGVLLYFGFPVLV